MPQYKLYYWPARGRAEIVRLVFALAEQEFEDYRFKDGEWPTIKPKAPFGFAPILEIDGEMVLSQSLTISRYLARKFGLAGKNEMEEAKVDWIVDCGEDFMRPLMAFFYEKDEAKKAELWKKFNEEQIPSFMERFEKVLSASKSGYFVGDKITWCDLHFVNNLCTCKALKFEVCLEKYPCCKALQDKVEGNERIAAWMAKRPASDH